MPASSAHRLGPTARTAIKKVPVWTIFGPWGCKIALSQRHVEKLIEQSTASEMRTWLVCHGLTLSRHSIISHSLVLIK